MSSCAEMRHALGVYVLGAIEPADRARVEEHLAGCAACRDELAGLAGLPALLSRVTPEEVGLAADPVDPALLDESLLKPLLARVAAERRRSRTRGRLLTTAAAVLVVLAGVVAGVVGLGGPGPGQAPPAPQAARPSATFSAKGPASTVSARVAVSPREWGTSVSLQLSGVEPYTTCRLVAIGRGGERDVAASWRATYAGAASVTGATALQAHDIARFDVMTGDNQRLVAIPMGSTSPSKTRPSPGPSSGW